MLYYCYYTRPNSRHHLPFFYRSLQVGDVNVRPEPALPCKDPQFLAQCLINIASNHPRLCTIAVFRFECSHFENPASHKYVDAKGRRIFKATSQSSGYSCINAAQNDERGQELKSSFSLLSLFSSISCSCISIDSSFAVHTNGSRTHAKRAIILFKVRRKLFSHC